MQKTKSKANAKTRSVFICWSGAQSNSLAEAVKALIEATWPDLKKRKAVFVSGGIEKGSNWFDSIMVQLETSSVGIVCLTSENLNSPWMHFEAGALARGFAGPPHAGVPSKPPLFTLLHKVSAAELKGPLSSYQSTSTTYSEMGTLLRSVGRILRTKVSQDPNKTPIKTPHWKKFSEALESASVKVSALIPNFEAMFQRKTFNEPVHLCSDQAWLGRYEGARITHERLWDSLPRVQSVCAEYEQGLFEMLLRELDSYSMVIQTLLVGRAEKFKLLRNGELDIDEATRTCCEDRRLAIRSLAGRLLHPLDVPQKEEAVRFLGAETNEERKMIIHRLEGAIRLEREPTYRDSPRVDAALRRLTENTLPLFFRQSSWDLDRIYYYMLVHYFGTLVLRWEPAHHARSSTHRSPKRPTQGPEDHERFCAARDVEMEVERFQSKSKGGSLIPLTYALVAVQALKPHQAPRDSEARPLVAAALDVVDRELQGILRTPAGRPIQVLLSEIRQADGNAPRSRSR